MIKKISIILSVSLLALLLTNCTAERTRQEKISTIISDIDSPFFVATATPQNLIDKSGTTDGVLPWTYETLFGFFMLEEETGIDNNTQIQFVAGKGSGVGLPNMYGIFKIKDQEKFKIMLKKELNADVKEKDGFKYFSKSKESYIMVWDDEIAIAGSVPINLASLFGGGDEGAKTVNRCISLLKAANEKEIDTKYVEFLNKEADVATFFETKGLVSYLTASKMLKKSDVADYKDSYEGNTFESYLNFENGAVKWEHKMFLSQYLLEKIDFVPESGISNDLFNFGKSSSPMFKYSFNVNPSLLIGYFKGQMKDDEYNEFEEGLTSKGFSVDDITNTFTGEVMVMLDGMNTTTEIVDYGYGVPFEITNNEPIMGVAVAVKNTDVFSKLGEELSVSPNGMMELEEGFYGYLSEGVFFASNDTAWINQVASGRGMAIQDEKDKLKTEPYGFYASFGNPAHKTTYDKEFPIAEIIENIWGYANLSEAEVNIILKNKSENSLRVITKYISDYLVEEENMANEEFKKILDQEVVESIEQGIDEVEKALEEIDVEDVVNDIFKEIGK